MESNPEQAVSTTQIEDDGAYKIKRKAPAPPIQSSNIPTASEPRIGNSASTSSVANVERTASAAAPFEDASLGKRAVVAEASEQVATEIPETHSQSLADVKPKPTKPEKPGSNLSEDGLQYYEFSKHLGSGTFGVVSKYKDLRTKRYVAIKKVTCEDTASWQNREFAMLQRLLHPNIVRVKSSFRTEEQNEDPAGPPKGYLHIVMDYIPDNLHKIVQHFVKTNATVPDTLIMIYSYQLFRCLHFLRVHSVAHRDIKPQNILVDTSSHQLFFCDFGSAKVLKSDEPSEDYICSRFYRAPELLYGNKHYSCAVDTWSVGCVVAEMVLGMPLFVGKNTQDQITRIIEHLGEPDDAEMKAMGSKFPANPRTTKTHRLKERLQTKINKDGLDLLSRVFVYDPEKRIKPLEALQHPYFDSLRLKSMTINKKPITDLFNFNSEESKGYERYVRKLTPDWYQKQ